MNKLERLMEAQKYAMSIRPKVGGFPVLAETLRQAGVRTNRWSLPACQSVFEIDGEYVVQQGAPLVTGTVPVPMFNCEALITAIRSDQKGLSSFPEFLQSAWAAGVISYDVDFVGRKVTYFGATGDSYVESYPAVGIPKRD